MKQTKDVSPTSHPGAGERAGTAAPSACEKPPKLLSSLETPQLVKYSPLHTHFLPSRRQDEVLKSQASKGDHQGHVNGKLQLAGLPGFWEKGGKEEVAILKRHGILRSFTVYFIHLNFM